MQTEKTEQLIIRARQREPDAFVQLMQLHMKDMYKVSLAILMNDEDAADAIQDTILTCWEKIHTLRQMQYFHTWLTRILINKCYDIRIRARERLRKGRNRIFPGKFRGRKGDFMMKIAEFVENILFRKICCLLLPRLQKRDI